MVSGKVSKGNAGAMSHTSEPDRGEAGSGHSPWGGAASVHHFSRVFRGPSPRAMSTVLIVPRRGFGELDFPDLGLSWCGEAS